MSSRILTVVPGTPVEYKSDTLLTVPTSITVNPNGGTVTVSVKTAIGGTYQAVPDGDLSGNITTVKMACLAGPVNAIKFTAATQTATVEIAQ